LQRDGLSIVHNAPLARYTRFEVGGPALILADASTETALSEALADIRESAEPYTVIGGGTNLVAADEGYDGVVLRYTNTAIEFAGSTVQVSAGAALQNLVDGAIARALKGLETMTGSPGWVGGAVYGNAGAYGHSIHERISSVRLWDVATERVREIDTAACQLGYRESIFKRRTDWIVLSTTLQLDSADPGELLATASGILKIRNEKYPPTMRCAGSIFKNLLWSDLPESLRRLVPAAVVREGKIPSAYFLEQAGAKGLQRGGVRVADYHANLIFNLRGGTAKDVRELIDDFKCRVREKFALELEEEVQYI